MTKKAQNPMRSLMEKKYEDSKDYSCSAKQADPGIRTLSALLMDAKNTVSGEMVSFGRILEMFHERGFGVLLFILSLPMAVPFPKPPGLTFVFSVPLFLLTIQQAMGRHTVWIPGQICKRTIRSERLSSLIENTVPWVIKLERFTRPRLGRITQGVFSRISGGFGVLMSLTIFLLPFPGFNNVPGLSLALLGIGDVMRDGLAIIAGIITGTLWIAFLLFLVLFVGTEGFMFLENKILSIL